MSTVLYVECTSVLVRCVKLNRKLTTVAVTVDMYGVREVLHVMCLDNIEGEYGQGSV